MATTGTKRAKAPAKKPVPVQTELEPDVMAEQPGDVTSLGPPATPETEWASAEDLLVPDFEDIFLPILGKKVRVYTLDEPKVAQLQFLPDLIGFTKLLQEMSDEKALPVGDGNFASENAVYMAVVAHVAVIDPSVEPVEGPCETCDFSHLPSLWSVAQTRRLKQMDVAAIMDIALQAGLARAVRPFFTGAMLEGTSPLASSGASTPEPTSPPEPPSTSSTSSESSDKLS